MKALLRKLAKSLARPARGFFDPRFRDLAGAVDDARQLTREAKADIASTNARITELEARVSSDTQTSAEFAATFRRSTDRLRDELHAMWGWATAGLEPGLKDLLERSAAGDREADLELGKLLHDLVPGAADRVVGTFEGVRLPIGPGTADFLNWAGGHTGPAAQAGMWFNPAVVVNHHDGTVRPGDVNERIVEVPWVMGLAATLEPGSLVLDFGATESTVSLSLASLGLDVIAADLRPYPLTHPRLRSVVGPIEQWDGPERPLDAIFCVSALEHVGIGAYDEAPTAGDLDHEIMRRFARWLKPGGEIAFTAPYGHWAVDDLQRVYDGEHLDALFAGWTITQRAVCVQTASDRWERVEGEPPPATWDDGTRGVVLVRATPAAVKLRHRILFDLQATQSQAHADRGVARYVKDQVRAMRRLGVGDALLLNPNLPFPRNLDQDLLTSPDLRWSTQTEIRRIVESGDRPAAYYLTSPFELSQWAEGDVPAHLLRGDMAVAGTLYDLIPLLFPDRYLTRPDLERRYRGRIEQLHHLDLVLTISEHTRRDALRCLDLDPAKVRTIGFGVSPYFHPPAPGEQPDVAIAQHTPQVRRPFVLAVLGGDPRKNADRLFEAWAEARRAAGLEHQLVVTCSLDPGTQAAWEQSARSRGLEPGADVVLTNWQPDHVLRALYQRCELFVFPSLYEGAGLPLAEAVACGAPCITSSTSSMPEVLDWDESTFDPESVDAIAAAIVRGIEDEGFRTELRARGAARAGLLTWDQVARRSIDALADLPEPSAGRTVLPTRIALVGPTPPTASGIADYNARLIPALAERCELDVFTASAGRTCEHPNLRWFPMRALRDTCSPYGYDAVIYTVGNSDHHHELYNLAEEFPGLLWMHDVRLPGLYLTYAEATFAATETRHDFLRDRLLRQYRRRTPVHVRDEVDQTPSHYNELGLGLSKELATAARGVVVSSALARRLLALDQQPDARIPPSWTLPLAVPTPWGDREGRAPAAHPVLVSLGMVSPLKGAELLVSALAALRRTDVDARLVFVGPVDDGYRRHLDAHAAAVGVAEHVELTGHVSEAAYREWLATATAAVQLRVSTNGESSAAVTDALAAGLPVVTNVHAGAELPDGTVALVPLDVDPTGLAADLHDVLAPERLDALAAAGHAFARSWGFGDVADSLLELVRDLR